MSTTTTTRINPILAAMQAATAQSEANTEKMGSLLEKFSRSSLKYRARRAVAIQENSYAVLSEENCAIVEANMDGLEVAREARFELADDHYAAPTFKGACWVYRRVRNESGKVIGTVKVTRYASPTEVLLAYGMN
jgi:hypothetical protein